MDAGPIFEGEPLSPGDRLDVEKREVARMTLDVYWESLGGSPFTESAGAGQAAGKGIKTLALNRLKEQKNCPGVRKECDRYQE